MKHAVFLLVTILISCTSSQKSFERVNEGYRHKSSQVVFPSTVSEWKLAEDVPTENLSPEIELAVLYANTSSTKDFKPYATVYVVSGDNALDSIKQRVSNLMPDAKRTKNRLTNIDSGPANVEVYTFKTAAEKTEGLVSVKKPTNVESWFIQTKNDPHLVFWVTIDADSKQRTPLPIKFVDDFLTVSKVKK